MACVLSIGTPVDLPQARVLSIGTPVSLPQAGVLSIGPNVVRVLPIGTL
jgi:hypothetical protein